MNKYKYTLYSDMDGVITDFDSQFKKFSRGVPPADYEKNNGIKAFWDLIDNKVGISFWTSMPWMKDGKHYWDYIKKYKPILLSSPSIEKESRIGKRLWVKKHLPGTKLILAFANKKFEYAEPNNILIDDKPENIQQWIDAGGIGILYISAESTINNLKKLGL